jgi:hypothetical protein
MVELLELNSNDVGESIRKGLTVQVALTNASYLRELVVEAVGEGTGPYVGDVIARSSGDHFCKRLGFNQDRLSGEEVERLLTDLRKGLKVFLGENQALEVIDEIRGLIEKRSQA